MHRFLQGQQQMMAAVVSSLNQGGLRGGGPP